MSGMSGNDTTFVQMLSCNPTLDYVNQFKTSSEQSWYFYDIAAASLSCFSLAMVAGLILFDKRL